MLLESKEKYTTIVANSETEIVIKKSRFIAYSFNINSVKEAEERVDEINKMHNATHVCWAYSVIDGGIVDRFTDNGEPQGTAGKPILNVIKRRMLSNVIVLVVRYYGGIMLGANGLIRAYGGSCVEVLDASGTKDCILNSIFEFSLSLKEANIFDSLKAGYFVVLNKEYGTEVSYKVAVYAEKENEFKQFLQNTLNRKVKTNFIEHKFI